VPLDLVAQQLDFSLGAFQAGALEREPSGAAEQIVGLLGADGLPYRRGGSTYKSNAASGSSGLLWVADQPLLGGRRTVFQRVADTQWRMLDTNDATPVQITNSGAAMAGTAVPFRPPVINGIMQIAYTPTDAPRWYGGSRKSADYTTGTITVDTGDTVVTGIGTSWLANADAGMILWVNAVNGFIPVKSIDTNTQLTLAYPWDRTPLAGAGSAYELNVIHTGSVGADGVFYTADGSRAGALTTIQASIAGRFAWVSGNRVYLTVAGTLKNLDPNDYHSFPTDGRGLGVLRDSLLVFTAGGVYAVSGLAYPLVDPGSGDALRRVELVNQDVIAWGHEGIASWEGALVVPALDDVYLMDSLGAPTPIGDRILDLYLSYVRAGYVPGVAEVYNGHYFLPILNGTAWVDTLVCRLQPSHSGNNFAWTQLSGDGATVAAFAERQTVPPLLLAASRQTTSRVLDNSAFFKPAGTVKNDASGNGIPFVVKTIDYPTGNSVSNFVHHVRLRYELTDAAADNPTISAVAAVDGGAGGNTFALTGVAAEDVGEKVWRVNRHAKNVQFTFTVANASASCKIKSVEVFVRHSGRQ
jgi:hypothetical protein